MKKNESITSIMATDVETVQEGQPLSVVRHLMTSLGVHHVPVTEGKKLVGLVSFTDMMKLNIVLSGATEHTIDSILDQQFTIKDVMTRDLVTLSNKDNVRQAAKSLADGNFHSLPVVDSDGNVVGIVTSTDLIKYLSDQY